MSAAKDDRAGPRPRARRARRSPPTFRATTGAAPQRVFKLSSNETPLGPSPLAVEAYRANADKLHVYPEGSARILREAIAATFGLNPERIVCGNGSDELLTLLAQNYLSPGDEAIYSAHGFLVYRIAILASGGTPVVAPENDETAQVDAILACVTPRTRLVYLANPNNPTGTYLPYDEVKRLHAGLPENVLLVLDAAYSEYVRRNDYASGVELAAEAENVVMTRTFSKIFGLANLRIGWAYGPASVIDALNRTRGPFNVNGPALAAGAAALADRVHLELVGRAQCRLARLADARDRGARPPRHAVDRQFPADPFPRHEGAGRGRGGCVPARARARASPRRRLRLPERASHDGRDGGGEPRFRRALADFLSGRP